MKDSKQFMRMDTKKMFIESIYTYQKDFTRMKFGDKVNEESLAQLMQGRLDLDLFKPIKIIRTFKQNFD